MKGDIHETMEFYRGYLHGIVNLTEKAETMAKLHLFEILYEEIDDFWVDLEKDLLKVMNP